MSVDLKSEVAKWRDPLDEESMKMLSQTLELLPLVNQIHLMLLLTRFEVKITHSTTFAEWCSKPEMKDLQL